MSSKPIDLPPEIAKAFIRDMRAFHAEKSPIERDEIAIRQLVVLNEYLGRESGRFELSTSKRCSFR